MSGLPSIHGIEKSVLRAFLLIISFILILPVSILILNSAGTFVDHRLLVKDPFMVVACFWVLMTGLVIGTHGYKFDELNARNYDLYQKLKNNETTDILHKQNTRLSGPYTRLYLRALSWADRRQDPITSRRLVYLICFLNTLIFLPILVATLFGVILLTLELLRAFGPPGLLGSIVAVILLIYIYRFKQVNQYVVDIIVMLKSPAGLSDAEKMRVARYSAAIVLAIIAVCLMASIAGKFVIAGDQANNPYKNDFILGSWTAITDHSTSNITFYGDGNFTWGYPIFGKSVYAKGTWKNVGNETHKVYTISYYDPDVRNYVQRNLTFTRSYYHAYGNIIIDYPYFHFDNSNEPFGSYRSTAIEKIPDHPTVIPPLHLSGSGKDVIVGAWIDEHMQEFDWYWVFNEDGTYQSINGGITDETGTWTNLGQNRYKVMLPDGNGRYVDYSDGKIYNEHYPQGTFTWVGYTPDLPF